MSKYGYSLNEENYYDGADTIEETIQIAIDHGECEVGQEILVCEKEHFAPEHFPDLPMELILDDVRGELCDSEFCWYQDDLFTPDKKQVDELEAKLNEVFKQWLDKHRPFPKIWSAIKNMTYTVTEEDLCKK